MDWNDLITLNRILGLKAVRKPWSKLNKILSGILKLIILLGILWVPISYLLAGNLSFSFTERESFQGGQRAMRWFWGLSYGIGALLILIVCWIPLLFKKKKILPRM
ncbi:Hypothetical protein I595_2394 [Croceitalea dokdonensis DOKDO 023]|uniref:Uncharacterized protein n=1 Tax=Croceitalea dokdonensis DOKDO 023 TaxID=1300341 RepID=A0A0P7ARC0_9FLAO|nr:hypothetical protein [Croceitalea dokdonensis]KPM31130.1 Hypothetical protein I595_2394 [Croceitalea dokdonensis DOKDO 023]